jgi:hypothetical protein
MSHESFQELMFFFGFMATLGAFTKIVLAIVNRRREEIKSTASPQLDEIAQRLARLEQAVDTTAVEVERIAEGQRFTTKLLAETAGRARQPAGS